MTDLGVLVQRGFHALLVAKLDVRHLLLPAWEVVRVAHADDLHVHISTGCTRSTWIEIRLTLLFASKKKSLTSCSFADMCMRMKIVHGFRAGRLLVGVRAPVLSVAGDSSPSSSALALRPSPTSGVFFPDFGSGCAAALDAERFLGELAHAQATAGNVPASA